MLEVNWAEMDLNKNFLIGDWITALRGIGQVMEINNIYFEEQDVEVACGEKQIGEPKNVLVIYKIFCDFNFKIRTRSRWDYCTNSLCDPLCGAEKATIEKLIHENPRLYDKYQQDSNKDWMGQGWLFDALIKPEDWPRYQAQCEAIKVALGEKFFFPAFIHCLYAYSIPVPIIRLPNTRADDFGNLRLNIFNKLFRSEERRAVYTDFKYAFVDIYTVSRK
jgi:hypothetical protein